MSRFAIRFGPLLALLLGAALLPAHALAEEFLRATSNLNGHFVDPGNSLPLKSTATTLTETFDDPLGGWRSRWLGMNTNMKNYYVCFGSSDEDYRGNNPCGLWICDGSAFGGDAIITFDQPFGASITHFEMGIQAFTTSTYTIYNPSGGVVYTTPLSPDNAAPYGCYTTNYAVDTPDGIGRFEITGGGQVEGNTAIDNVSATIGETNHLPDCSLAVASEAVLWPPNHKYHAISILGVTDPDSGDVVTITVTGITQDEPLNTRGDGNTCPDGLIVNGEASVRAERAGTPGIPGNGRVYAINYTASDGNGGECPGTVYVCVPHDQGSGNFCIDDGQKYNSVGPCTGGSQLSQEIAEVGLTVGTVTGSQAALEFALPHDTQVELSVFDVAGRRLATVENGSLAAGLYQRSWDMSSATKGLYFVRLRAGAVTLTKTVLKIR